jgi:hypothetical protein
MLVPTVTQISPSKSSKAELKKRNNCGFFSKQNAFFRGNSVPLHFFILERKAELSDPGVHQPHPTTENKAEAKRKRFGSAKRTFHRRKPTFQHPLQKKSREPQLNQPIQSDQPNRT